MGYCYACNDNIEMSWGSRFIQEYEPWVEDWYDKMTEAIEKHQLDIVIPDEVDCPRCCLYSVLEMMKEIEAQVNELVQANL